VGDVLLIPESNVRLEPMDVRGSDSGEDGRAWSLPTYDGGGDTDGGSGRRLGVRIRTLREGLGALAVGSLDVLPDGVGEGARLGVVRVGEEGMGGGDGVASLGGGEIGSAVDMPASASFSNSARSPLSLFRSDPAAPAAPAGGVASRTSKGVADEPKFGDSCRISLIDPMSPLLLGATAPSFSFSFCPFSISVCVGAEGAALSLSLSLDAPCCGVGARARNVTLRLSRLSPNMGRYCDCGLNPDVAFRLVFSRMVSISCCMRRSVKPLRWPASYEKERGEEGGVPNRMQSRTYHFLTSLPLSAFDHATPMLPYDHEQDGKRHAAYSTAHNCSDGRRCTATARMSRQT
jgi:hypothetical protein